MTDREDSRYLGVHIYYNVIDLRAILLECVEPLVRHLAATGRIERYFVIRYWDGGAHVRLRLLPAEGVTHADLKREIEPAVDAFLRQRPSLFDPDPAVMGPLMRMLYVMEYGQAAYEESYGADGDVPLQPNNSYRYVPYVPETRRYGGVHAMALSERHFHVSSEIAFEALRETNSHVRTSTLGLAFQLMLHFATAYFGSREQVTEFFRRYAGFVRGFEITEAMASQFDRTFARQAQRIDEQVHRLESLNERLVATDPGVLGRYARNARQLRGEVARLHAAGLLSFDPPAPSQQQAGNRLLTSYLHMMNNRLGVLIVEEVYMAHMMVRSLERDASLAREAA